MIVNQMGGGSGGEAYKKEVKTFAVEHSANVNKWPTITFNLSNKPKSGEIVVLTCDIKVFDSMQYGSTMPTTGETINGRYILYLDGDGSSGVYYDGTRYYDTTATGNNISASYAYYNDTITITPTRMYSENQGSTYVARTETWFKKE